MPGTRFPLARILTALTVVAVLVAVGAVVVGRSGDDDDRVASGSTTISTTASDGGDDGPTAPGDEPTDAADPTDPSLTPEGDADAPDPIAQASSPGAPTPAAPLPVLPPFTPPVLPEAQPLGILNLDPAAAGITDFQGMGVPTPAGFGGPSSFTVGSGCAASCIDSGVAYPLHTGAHIEVVTDTPSQIWVVVWNDSVGHYFVSDSGLGSAVTSFSADFTELEGGTTYQAMAVAEDLNGYSNHLYGELETLRRNVRFGLTDVDLINQPNGTIEFSTSKWLDGQQYPGGWETPFPTLEDVDETVELVLRLTAVKECDGPCEAIGFPDGVPVAPTGGVGRFEWIALSLWDPQTWDTVGIDLENTPALAEHPTSRTFQVTLTNGPEGSLPDNFGNLSAVVEVTVWVTYS